MSHPANPPTYSGPYTGPEPGIQVIHVQPTPMHYPVLVGQPVGPEPAIIVCQSCRYQIVSNIEVRPALRTHLWALCLLVVGCWPCVCLPYCIPACMDVDHYCPNCNAFVGKYKS